MTKRQRKKNCKQTDELLSKCLEVLKPPPNMTISQWADAYRMISAEASAEPGKWHTDRAPYQRTIMDAIGNPHVRRVVVMTAAQIGKTDAFILNTLAYYMDYAPAPILIMEPTLEMAQTLSKERVSPMLRDTPKLQGMVNTKSRDSGNTILKKIFPGGVVSIIGANSPSSLRMRPVKVLLADEVDGYPPSAKDEGDPLALAEKRQTTFWDKKTVMVSTPTIKQTSRIEKEFENSTKEEWNLPCPECGHYQPLSWDKIIFNKEDLDEGIKCACEKCGTLSTEMQWKAQGMKGKFVAAEPEAETRGFHLNTFASPFCSWKSVVEKFLKAKQSLDQGDPQLMKTWVNTELGESWEEEGEKVDDNELTSRRELYDAAVPDDVLILTAGVDTQDDRFEIEVVGWGEGKENWGIRYQKIYGDLKEPRIWEDLDRFLQTTFYKKDGTPMHIDTTCIDIGGHFSLEVERFCKPRTLRKVYAIKGASTPDAPFLRKPSTGNRVETPLFVIGVNAGKAVIYQRLNVAAKGPNYCHFPLNEGTGYDELYFKGLASEKMVIRMRKGRPVIVWDQIYKRNEPLDCRNYAMAALEITNPVLQKQPEQKQPTRKGGWRKISNGI